MYDVIDYRMSSKTMLVSSSFRPPGLAQVCALFAYLLTFLKHTLLSLEVALVPYWNPNGFVFK